MVYLFFNKRGFEPQGICGFVFCSAYDEQIVLSSNIVVLTG